MKINYWVLFLLVFNCVELHAETNALDRKISISVRTTSVKVILKRIEELAHTKFSYNPVVIDENKKMDLELSNETVEKGLAKMFGAAVRFKEVGNHIVLLKGEDKRVLQERKKAKETVTITGFVFDRSSGKPLEGASIYEVDNRYSAISTSTGAYTIVLPKSFESRSLYLKKIGYNAEVVVIDATAATQTIPKIYLEPMGEIGTLPTRSLEDRLLSGQTISEDVYTHGLNLQEINDTRLFQVSLVPSVGIGSNLSTNGLITNKYSFNILGGYSNGVDVFEFGGILNTVKGDVTGGQIAGVTNLVGGRIRAIQVGGIANVVRGDAEAIQIGGIANLVGGSFRGFQVSGIAGLNDSAHTGAQLSGICSVVTGKLVGTQVSGISSFANAGFVGAQIGGISSFAKGDSKGVQLAGIYNHTVGNFLGGQISGIGNRFGRGKSWFQLAGIFNSASTNSGLQIASIFNYAATNRGVQLGLINVSDSSKGVAFGLINYVRTGFRQLELSSNTLTVANVSLKSGTRRFYNTYHVGVHIADSSLIAVGLGFGTYLRFSNRLGMNLEVSQHSINKNEIDFSKVMLVTRYATTLDVKLSRKVSLFVGPDLALIVSKTATNFGSGFELRTGTNQYGATRFLLGAQAGIRFSKI